MPSSVSLVFRVKSSSDEEDMDDYDEYEYLDDYNDNSDYYWLGTWQNVHCTWIFILKLS